MGDIVTLDRAKEHLNVDSDDQDDEIADFVTAASEFVEWMCGPCTPTTYTEVKPAGRALALNHRPVISIASITPRLLGYAAVDLSTLMPVDPSGIVELAYCGGTFYTPMTVVYTAGRASAPKSLVVATLDIVEYLWLSQNGGDDNPRSGEEVTVVPGYGPMPSRAIEMMTPFRRPPAVG